MAAKKRKRRTIHKAKTPDRGLANQVAGAAQEVYGQAAKATRNGASNLDQWSRGAIQTQPYTSALAVFGAGWLLGEMGLLLGRNKSRGVGSLLGGKAQGIDGLLGRNKSGASVMLRILAAALVDIGPASR